MTRLIRHCWQTSAGLSGLSCNRPLDFILVPLHFEAAVDDTNRVFSSQYSKKVRVGLPLLRGPSQPLARRRFRSLYFGHSRATFALAVRMAGSKKYALR